MYTTCGKCHLYSRALGRCVKGKVNPSTLKGTIQAMTILGVSSICSLSQFKNKAIVSLTEANGNNYNCREL